MASISTLTDNFNTINPAKWDNYGWSAVAGNLQFLSAGTWEQPGLISKSTYSMAGGSISFQVGLVQTNSDNDALCMCLITEDPVGEDAPACGWVIRDTAQGVRADLLTPTQPAFFGNVPHTAGNRYRIREFFGYLLFEYSTNGTTWNYLYGEALTHTLPAGGANTTAGIVGDTPEGGVTTIRVNGVNA